MPVGSYRGHVAIGPLVVDDGLHEGGVDSGRIEIEHRLLTRVQSISHPSKMHARRNRTEQEKQSFSCSTRLECTEISRLENQKRRRMRGRAATRTRVAPMLFSGWTICGHVRSDICPLRLQGHLVDAIQHPPCVRAVKLQLASLRHVGVNLQTDDVMQSSLESSLARGRNAHVLGTTPEGFRPG